MLLYFPPFLYLIILSFKDYVSSLRKKLFWSLDLNVNSNPYLQKSPDHPFFLLLLVLTNQLLDKNLSEHCREQAVMEHKKRKSGVDLS